MLSLRILVPTRPANLPDLDSIDAAHGGMAEVAPSAVLELRQSSCRYYITVFHSSYGSSLQLLVFRFGFQEFFSFLYFLR